MISLPSGTRYLARCRPLLICVNPSTVWGSRYSMCWMINPFSGQPVYLPLADGEDTIKILCGLMLMVCACSPNALRKVSLSGLRCVTVRYIRKHWVALCNFCDDGLAEADNNTAERALRAVCLGKKNSYDLCQILSPKRPYAAPGASLYRGLKNLKQSDCILDFTNSYSGILAP
ncbi:hypothetical protein EUAG_05020 [Escherichia coli O104:H4 str. C227-11]|nr:hypothetical protein EUAG_05020 [Escherichia coli O104:H4 str. C227-11]